MLIYGMAGDKDMVAGNEYIAKGRVDCIHNIWRDPDEMLYPLNDGQEGDVSQIALISSAEGILFRIIGLP